MRGLIAGLKKPGYTLTVSTNEGEAPQDARVEVRFPDGRGWCARLHTPESVRSILDEWHREGERRGERSGLYFWAPGVIVVREISREGVLALVDDLMKEGELELAFVPLGGRPEAP